MTHILVQKNKGESDGYFQDGNRACDRSNLLSDWDGRKSSLLYFMNYVSVINLPIRYPRSGNPEIERHTTPKIRARIPIRFAILLKGEASKFSSTLSFKYILF